MQFIHGGDIDGAAKAYHFNREEILDFSGNINPLGISPKAKEAIIKNIDVLCTYPDNSYRQLRKSIALYCGVPYSQIIIGNGSTEIISAAIASFLPAKAVIIEPAYSEYERNVKNGGGQVVYYPLQEQEDFKVDVAHLSAFVPDDAKLLIFCNPNNPTGSAVDVAQLSELCTVMAEKDVFIIVDETYAEFAGVCYGAAPLLKRFDNLLIIRGVSKFFAAPGLRLGYGITANDALHKAIAHRKDPWSVGSLSAIAGVAMFGDQAYIEKTKAFMDRQRQFVISEMRHWQNIKCYPTVANFILFRLLTKKTNASEIFDTLIQQKMMVRDAGTFPFLDQSYLRICFLDYQSNEQILIKLKELIEG